MTKASASTDSPLLLADASVKCEFEEVYCECHSKLQLKQVHGNKPPINADIAHARQVANTFIPWLIVHTLNQFVKCERRKTFSCRRETESSIRE